MIFIALLVVLPAAADIVINEIADKGTSGDHVVCAEEEWIELAATADITLDGFQIHDDKGLADEDVYTFPEGTSLAAGEKLLLCRKTSFTFKIGTGDTISITDTAGVLVDTTGVMPGEGRDNKVWARIPDVTGAFQYSGTPTAGAENVLSDPPTVPPVTTTPAPVLQEPSQGELDNPESSCARLRAEFGLDCNACLETLPAAIEDQAACAARTVADDTQAEIDALFGDRKEGKPRELFANTSFLFATDDVWSIEFDLSEADWASMTADPAAEEWHTGKVRFTKGDGTALVNPATGTNEWTGVGIRFKGFFGSLRICLTGMIGECTKLSYKLKFNHEDEDARFFGLKVLQLHAASSDVTKMRERLSYGLFREMGVPAPRSSFSTVALKVGDGADTPVTQLGVHLLTEVIDGRFTEAFFDGGDGNLYKEAWPGTVGEDGTVNEVNFLDALRTNEGVDADASALVMFTEAINAANNDYDLATVAKKWLSTKRWAAQFAVDRAIEHWDGPVNFRLMQSEGGGGVDDLVGGLCEQCKQAAPCYGAPICMNGVMNTEGIFAGCAQAAPCAGCYPESSCGSGGARERRSEDTFWTHNFFLYEEDRKNVSKREFDLVPWDLDSSWVDPDRLAESMGARPDWDKAVCAPGQETDCIKCETFEGGLSPSMPPSCFKLVRAFARGLRRYYMDAAATLLAGPLQPCRVNAKLDRWAAALKPHLDADQAAGLYPEWSMVKQMTGAMGMGFTTFSADFKSRVVPHYTNTFKSSVTCGLKQNTDTNADAWSAVIEEPSIGVMFQLDGFSGAINSMPDHPAKEGKAKQAAPCYGAPICSYLGVAVTSCCSVTDPADDKVEAKAGASTSVRGASAAVIWAAVVVASMAW